MKMHVAALLAALTATGCSMETAENKSGGESGTATTRAPTGYWVAEDITGHGVIDDSRVTLEIDPAGRISGRGGCNRYGGAAKIADGAIAIGPVAATQMACAEALMAQEQRLFEALNTAERYSFDANGFLLIHSKGADKPTRFAPDTELRVVAGSASYRQRIALPPTARLEAVVEDVSLADAPATRIASSVVEPAGQVPIAFSMGIEPSKIQPGHRYALRITIHDGERLLFTTDTHHAVLEGRSDENMEILLVPAS